jgi:hypothetical protein
VPEPDGVTWLMNWYLAQCDEDWEHQHGISIDTLDNPGWSLTVDLEQTSLKGKRFEPIFENVAESQAPQGLNGDVRWLVAEVEGTKFKAYGGPRDLPRLIEAFRSFATEADTK